MHHEIERRRFPRVPTRIDVEARRAQGEQFIVESEDVSEGGIGALSDIACGQGEILELRFRLPTHPDTAIQATVRVAFSIGLRQGGHRLGLEFMEIPASALSTVKQHVRECLNAVEDDLIAALENRNDS